MYQSCGKPVDGGREVTSYVASGSTEVFERLRGFRTNRPNFRGERPFAAYSQSVSR